MKTPLSRTAPTRLFRAARRFLSGTLLSKCFGLVREVALASTFGASAEIASFMVAFRLAHFFRRFIGESGLAVAFIPHFEALKAKSPAAAADFFVKLSLSLKLLLLALSAAVAFGFYVGSSYMSGDWKEIFSLAAILSVSLFFIGLYALNQAFLQTSGRFFIGSAAPAAFNILFALGALLAHVQTSLSPIVFLSWMAVLGLAAQWMVTSPLVSRAHAKLALELSPTVAPAKLIGNESGKSIAKASFLGLFGLAAVQINNLIDGIFAKIADPSAPAYLWYAMRVYQLPLSLFAVSLASALLPMLSKHVKDQEAFMSCLRAAAEKILLFMIPVTGAMVVLAPTGLALLYGRGHFSLQSLAQTTYCLLGYGLGLVSSCFVIILAQAFYARGDYKTPSLSALFSVFLNIALNALFIFYWGLGGLGIALATSIASLFNAALLRWQLKEGRLFSKVYLIKVLFASVIACGTVLLWSVGKHDFSSKVLLGLLDQIDPLPFIAQLRALVLKGVAFGGIFWILLYYLRFKKSV